MKIQQYCSVCKAEYEMDVVPTADDDGVLWLQCPVCKGYLPKVRSASGSPSDGAADDDQETTKVSVSTDDDPAPTQKPDDHPPTAESAPTKTEVPAEVPEEGIEELSAMDPEQAVPYRPWQTYEVGDALHHLAWDDYGVVLAKETLPGKRRVVKVRFQDAGLVRLREDDEA